MPDKCVEMLLGSHKSKPFSYPGGYLCLMSYKFSFEHYFETTNGLPRSSFGCIESGRVELRAQGVNIKLKAGDVFYIPGNEKYSSLWTGTPAIAFYGIHTFPALDGMSETGVFSLCKAEFPAGYDPLAMLEKMYELLKSDNVSEKLRAVSMYYEFAALALPSLLPKKADPLPGLLTKVMDFIDRNSVTDLSVPELASRFHVSESTLYHLFKRYLGSTPVNYRNEKRIERSLDLIESGKTVEETATETGFNSSIHFRSVFIKSTGMTPSEYRKSRSQTRTEKLPPR